jgi:quinol monooxygenase YgiN
MVGFEIMVTVPRERRQEFLQTCAIMGDANCRDPACLQQTLFESVSQSNQFLWVEHWNNAALMDDHLKSSSFGVLLGAIAVLGESNEILRLNISEIQSAAEKSAESQNTEF